MREFNTSGPCDPALHYTVMREELVRTGCEHVRKSRYFTIFAPRQSGKTTYFQLLLAHLQQEGFTTIWLSFENTATLTKARFYEALTRDLTYEFAQQGLEPGTDRITDPLDLEVFFSASSEQAMRLVLVVDEFEGIPEAALGEVMHTFRKIYHKKERFCLHSLILVGVSTIAELVLSGASPFNITDDIQIPYFTLAEVEALIRQYTAESGQSFDPAVIKVLHDNTIGQPGLVNALCRHLIEVAVQERSRAVSLEDAYRTVQFFLTRKADKNIMNIVQKALRKKEIMMKLLFSDVPVEFSIDVPDLAYLYAHGVIDDIDGYVGFPVPLYAKRLVTAFRPAINGETTFYLTSAHDTVQDYLTADGGLDVNALLRKYAGYVRRRGFRAFDTEQLREAAWHYSLDGFLNFFIERLGGQTYIEVPTGRGRVDILIRYREYSYIIETKLFSDTTYFKRGKGQLAKYLDTEGLDEGYYVVFSHVHAEQDELHAEECIAGKRIYTHIIRINLEPPSRDAVPDELRAK